MRSALACIGVGLSVPGRVLCRGLDVRFEPGQVWAVLGRNGTGKTTLIHALAGLSKPAAGRIELDGRPLETLEPKARARAIGVLLQIEEGAFWGSVAEYVLRKAPCPVLTVKTPFPDAARIARVRAEEVVTA